MHGIKKTAAFTLVELLVAVSVVVLLLTFVLQLLTGTTATITASNKQLDTGSLARTVLDRFDNDFRGAILNNGATAAYYSQTGDAGNSAIAFLTASRARGPTTQTGAWTTDTRSALVGYKVTPFSLYINSTTTQSIPALARGDGRFTFSVQDIGNRASANTWDLFGVVNARVPNDITTNPLANVPVPDPRPDEKTLNWQVIASAIFRFHITFVLDDGSIVQTPPMFRQFYSNGDMTSLGCIPIAFSRSNSADTNLRYVKGLIVGLAVLDEVTRNLAYNNDNNFWTTIGSKISRPSNAGETPVKFWTDKLFQLTATSPSDPRYLFPPVRQNLRFYQRFFVVNR